MNLPLADASSACTGNLTELSSVDTCSSLAGLAVDQYDLTQPSLEAEI